MKTLFSLALLSLASVAISPAATVTYTSQALFLNAISDPYIETFNDLSGGPAVAGPINYASAPYSYSIAQTGSGFLRIVDSPADTWLSSNSISNTFTFTFENDNIYGVGGNFFATDFNGDYASGGIRISINGGTIANYSTTSATSFTGFVSDTPITSLVMTMQNTTRYNTVNDFIVGSEIPEPSTALLAALSLTGLAMRRRRS